MIEKEFKNLDELTEAYKKGGIGDGTIKKFLNSVIAVFMLMTLHQ